jgi:cell division septation protein DedD
MVQDFAKIRPEPVLERHSIEAPPAWTLLFTGLITGIAVGVFGCFLLYLSGNVPPLRPSETVTTLEPQAAPVEVRTVAVEAETVAEKPEDSLDLGFYRELQDYVVEVDATPVPLEPEITVETVVEEPEPVNAGNGRLIQIGAFQQVSSAQTQLGIVRSLGVDAFITQYARASGTLHAVQAGPFNSNTELNAIRSLLQRNDIDSIFVDRR